MSYGELGLAHIALAEAQGELTTLQSFPYA